MSWLKYLLHNSSFWFATLLLVIPMCVLTQLIFIEKAYLDPTFTGITNKQNIRNAVLVQGGRYQALEHYIADEIENNWTAKIVYERTKLLELNYNSTLEPVGVSFVSGGYEFLGIEPIVGILDSMEFPVKGGPINVAITDKFWRGKFSSDLNIVGKQIIVAGKLVTIVAVMPKSFKGFRKGSEVDVVIPFTYLTDLTYDSEQDIFPDTQSFILAKNSVLMNIESRVTSFLKEESLLFGEDKIILNQAIGVDSLEFVTVSYRVYLLKVLFIILFLFCFLAFIAYYSGSTEKKLREHIVRTFCGANRTQILLQEGLDILFTTIFILICFAFIFPFIDLLVKVFLPHVVIDYFTINWYEYVRICISGFGTLIAILSIVNMFQFKMLKANIGRGQSIGLGQKIQSYLIAATLVCFSSLALFFAVIILKNQIDIGGKKFGFEVENRFIVTFEYPKELANTFYVNDLAELLLKGITSSDVIEVSITSVPPFQKKTSYAQFYTPDLKPIGSGEHGNVLIDHVSPNYFKVAGIKLMKGSELVWGNYWQVIVNRTLWEKYLKEYSIADVKLIQIENDGYKRSLSVIGIVEDTLLNGRDETAQPIVYRLVPTITGFESLFINSTGTIEQIENAVKSGVQGVNVNFTNFKIESLEVLANQENLSRQAILYVSVFCALLMIVSTIIYSYNSVGQLVKQGAREIALRSALGASHLKLISSEFRIFCVLVFPCVIGLYVFLNHYYKIILDAMGLPLNTNIQAILLPELAFTVFMLVILHYLYLQQLKSSWNDLT